MASRLWFASLPCLLSVVLLLRDVLSSRAHLDESSRHTPCAVASWFLFFGGRHTECACYFGCGSAASFDNWQLRHSLNIQLLTPNRMVQESRFSSGRSVVVNFGQETWRDKRGVSVAPQSFHTFVTAPDAGAPIR